MVPRIAQRGYSFKGAGLYYLHDKGAMTSERVGVTLTLNVTSRTPEGALKEMAWTDMHKNDLRAASGSRAGRKASAGNVYSYSLAWAIGETPSVEDMEAAAMQTLKALGLQEHQALMVEHKDTEHVHIHVIANLVHPQTGRVANVYKDQLTLSKWAQDYEERTGRVHCAARVENNAAREEGAYVKHKDNPAAHAPSIEELYASCDSGKAFRNALEEVGYRLGRGDRRGFIVMDQSGKIHSLSRQLKGQRAKDIKAYMSDLDISSLPSAKELEEEQPPPDDEHGADDAEIIEMFISSSHAKRKALIKTLDEDYGEEEARIAECKASVLSGINATGLRGVWNVISGRTKQLRSALQALKLKERKIKEKRIEAIQVFEMQQSRKYKILLESLQQERYLNAFCKTASQDVHEMSSLREYSYE